MIYNAVQEMLIERASFEARHGERSLAPLGMLIGRQLREAHSTQTRIKMQVELACSARLTIAEACELFGVAE